MHENTYILGSFVNFKSSLGMNVPEVKCRFLGFNHSARYRCERFGTREERYTLASIQYISSAMGAYT